MEERFILKHTEERKILSSNEHWKAGQPPPPYTIEACFISQEGEAFITADYCSRNEVHEIENSLRLKDVRLSWKAADALERTKLPHSLDWEKKTLIQMARSIREEDLHQDFTPE